MLDFLACQSPEKLVIDAEAIAMVKRLLTGVKVQTEPLATDMFSGIDFKADFLRQKLTRQLFSKEQHLPSAVIDRGSNRTWLDGGRLDTFARAKARVAELLAAYEQPSMGPEQERELRQMMTGIAQSAGMDELPPNTAEKLK
jgi:trimethylamine--corrinoid protein Co-methyltransferase